MPWSRIFSVTVLLVGLAGFFWMRGCDEALPDIEVADGMIHVRNNSEVEWRDVRIWVNEYYAIAFPTLRPSAFVREPIKRFVASQGQIINTSTTPITSVVVLARLEDGQRVRIVWGKAVMH